MLVHLTSYIDEYSHVNSNCHYRLLISFRLDDRHLRGSMTSDLKLPPESETDSIADYVDGENTGKLYMAFYLYSRSKFDNSMSLILIYHTIPK